MILNQDNNDSSINMKINDTNDSIAVKKYLINHFNVKLIILDSQIYIYINQKNKCLNILIIKPF